MSTVAVVGLGAMGSRIARRLLEGGHDVVVWNRTAGRAAELVELGAIAAASPADAAARAEAVITMVSDPPALAAVTEGPDGVAEGAARGATVIEMSTVGPTAVARLAASVPQLVDAPVLGSLAEAESGSLVILAGGDAALVERWTPLLTTLGSVLHVGPTGAGAAAKLVANATLFGTLGVLGEALALAQGLGLSPKAAYDVLAKTPLAAQAERRRAAIEAGDYPPRFALSLARKDAELIAAAAGDARLLDAVRSWFVDAEAAGRGSSDYAAVLATIIGSRST